MRLEGKSVVITGASGIAASAAAMAAAEGARVFVVSLGESDCRQLVERIREVGGDAGYAVADLTSEEEATAAFDEAASFLGSIDGLFAVAGGSGRRFGDGPAHDASLEGWSRTLEINTHPMFLSTHLALPHLREKGGSLVIMSSVLAESPSARLFATHSYAAAKGAANSFVKTLAAFYARDRIRVNAIAAGLVRTPMSQRAANDPETADYVVRKQPLAGGFLEPLHVAGAAVFLLSDDASQMTGQVLAVDGGWSVTEA